MPNWHAFTLKANGGVLRVLQTSCAICLGHDPASPPDPVPQFCEFQAIWDTGATNCVITQAVVNACGLQPIGMVQSHGAHGVQMVPVFLVNLRLPNGVSFPVIRVSLGDLPHESQVLIGMDVIAMGDFAVTNEGGITWFSYRIPAQAHIDYVAVHNEKVRKAKFSHGQKKKGKKR